MANTAEMLGVTPSAVAQNIKLADFYHWYAVSGLADVAMNNVGNPRKPSLFWGGDHYSGTDGIIPE